MQRMQPAYSLLPKFEQLKLIIGNYLDNFVIQETKLDPNFSMEQFMISGCMKPYRLDKIKMVEVSLYMSGKIFLVRNLRLLKKEKQSIF